MAKSTGRRLFEMLNDGYMTDITFVVQRTEIKGHRVVASSHGGVLKEVLNSQAKTFVIDEEISVDTFRTVLEFLYTGDCKVKLDNLSKLMDAAKSLQLKSLEHHCAQAKNVALEICKHIFPSIKVKVLAYGQNSFFGVSWHHDSELDVPPSTTISELKTRHIFDCGRRKFAANTFTLEHEGKELQDDVILASIYTPGKDLILKVHSVKFVVNRNSGKFPVTVQTADLNLRGEEIIKSQLYAYKDINPKDVFIHGLREAGPGSNVYMEVFPLVLTRFLLYTIMLILGIVDFYKSFFYMEDECYKTHARFHLCLGLFFMMELIIWSILPIRNFH